MTDWCRFSRCSQSPRTGADATARFHVLGRYGRDVASGRQSPRKRDTHIYALPSGAFSPPPGARVTAAGFVAVCRGARGPARRTSRQRSSEAGARANIGRAPETPVLIRGLVVPIGEIFDPPVDLHSLTHPVRRSEIQQHVAAEGDLVCRVVEAATGVAHREASR